MSWLQNSKAKGGNKPSASPKSNVGKSAEKPVMALASRPRAAAVMALLLLGATFTPAWANSTPKNLLEAAFGDQQHSEVSKVVIDRVDPWIMRVLSPSPNGFELGQARGDREAIILDHQGIIEIEDKLRDTTIIQGGCYGTSYTPKYMPVSWAVFLYSDTAKVASFYLDWNNCISTGTALYEVVQVDLPAYLRRMFSFMNY